MALGASPAAAATLTVTPSANLPDSTTVAVTGTGWNNGFGDTGGFVTVRQCTVSLVTCGLFGGPPTDAAGAFASSLAVSRVFTPDPPGPPMDCMFNGCVVRVEDFGEGTATMSHPITFASAAPKTPPTTTATATPTTGQRAAALKRCAKIKRKAKKKTCKKRARALPV
jgi:hypothetical protein